MVAVGYDLETLTAVAQEAIDTALASDPLSALDHPLWEVNGHELCEASTEARRTFNIMASPQVLLALVEVSKAAQRAVAEKPDELTAAVEHSGACGLWVELDDISGDHPVGECDCGLDALKAALSLFDPRRITLT